MLKNRLTYLFMPLISFWLMIMYEGYFMSVMFRAVIIFPVFLLIINFMCAIFMKVEFMNTDVTVRAGDVVRFGIKIKNRLPFPIQKMTIYYAITDNFGKVKKEFVVTNLKMFECAGIYIQFDATGARGGHVIFRKIYIYDFLGIFRNRCRFKKTDATYCIYPKEHEINIAAEQNIISADEGNGLYSSVRPGNDKSELFGIREYRENDDIRAIHWKLSVKKDDILVREYSFPIRQDVTVIPDLLISPGAYRDAGDAILNRYFELIHAIGVALMKRNIHYILYLPESGDEHIIAVSDENDREESERQALAACGSGNTGIRNIETEVLRGSVIYISSEPDDIFLEAIVSSEKVRKLVIIYILKEPGGRASGIQVRRADTYEAGDNIIEAVFSDISAEIEDMRTFAI